MKYLTFTFLILALAAVLAAIWRPDYVWQLGLTCIVFIIASATAATTKATSEAKKLEK